MSHRHQDQQPRPQAAPPRLAVATGSIQESPVAKKGPADGGLDRLPQFRVLLHNDPVNEMVFVVETICDLTPLQPQRATAVMLEAHHTGVALLLTTHRERAELYVEQFRSKNLTVTIEPAE